MTGARKLDEDGIRSQDQFRSKSLSTQHHRLHEAASSSRRRHLCVGHKTLQHPSTVRGPRSQTDSTNSSSTLAPLHGLNYISPSMIALAARKIYPHRIVITAPENERSVQWGSSLEAIKAVLDGVTVDDVIEEVLESVEVPL